MSLLHRLIRHEESEVWIASQSLWNYVAFFLAFVGSFTPPPAFLLCVWASLRAGSISRCILFVRECVAHNTDICVFYPLQSEAPDIFDYRRAEIAVYRASGPGFPLPFISLRNYVILDDNLPLRLWTAHQPLTVCSCPTIIYSFEREHWFPGIMHGFYGQTFPNMLFALMSAW